MGITGTRWGWTPEQEAKFAVTVMTNVPWLKEFHHGMCSGVDTQAHDVIRRWPGIRIIGHPSVDKTHQVERDCDELREEKTHFARNRDIVNETDGLVVVPAQMEHQPKGGTWYTHDYALKVGKPVLVIWPDGSATWSSNGSEKSK